jgi:WD40 repeat protein
MNGNVRLFAVSDGDVIRQVKARSGIVDAAWLPDGSAIVAAHKNKSLSIIDAETLKVGTTIRLPRAVEDIHVSPNGRSVAAVGGVSVFVIDIASADVRCALTHRLKVRGVVWLDALRLCSASDDYVVREWNAQTGTEIREICSTQRWVWSMQCSRDRQRLLIGTEDELPKSDQPGSGHAQVIDIASGEFVSPRITHSRTSEPCTVFAAFSPDERYIATGSADRTVALWKAETGEQLWQDEYGWMVFGIEFSPHGDRILAVGGTSAGLWDISERTQ